MPHMGGGEAYDRIREMDRKVKILLASGYSLDGQAKEILDRAEVGGGIRTDDLTEDQVRRIRQVIEAGYKVEGDLRREVSMNVKRLMDLNCYRGLRHKKGLPVHGQRTHTNARTRKGPRRVGVARKKAQTK